MPFDNRDIEMNNLPTKVRSLSQESSSAALERPAGTHNACSGSFSATLHQFVDSFRRDDRVPVNTGRGGGLAGSAPGSSHDHHRGIRYYDLGSANAKTALSPLSRELKGRHLQMIAIGGSIGE
jgi:amino acid transporter